MNCALIFAGGSGERMNPCAKPKQFLQLHGKEIIIHTIEQYERHELIDDVIVVCLESWIPYLHTILKKFGITKVTAAVPGGTTGQISIGLGVEEASKHFPDDTVMLIHDGVRPLISAQNITACIETVRAKGSAVTVCPAVETVVSVGKDGRIETVTDRSQCWHAKAPQCFYLKDLRSAHTKAASDGRIDFIDTASLMSSYGHELYTVTGSPENIKITTPADFYTFRALYEARENSQIFGIL